MRAGASAAGALQLVVGGEGVEGDEALTFGGVVGGGGRRFLRNHNSACTNLIKRRGGTLGVKTGTDEKVRRGLTGGFSG